jgi:hypothetical protein
VQHPGTTVTASSGPASAIYDIEFQLGDAAYRQYVLQDPIRQVSVFAGGRFGSLDQTFQQLAVSLAAGGTRATSTSIEFAGGGPMAGIDAVRRIDASGFSVYGRALAAALMGEFDSRYLMVRTSDSTVLAEAVWTDDHIVPMLEYELGLAWTSPLAHFRFSVGYLANHWFNVVTTPVFIDAVQDNNYVDVSDTISFTGLVGRAEFRW